MGLRSGEILIDDSTPMAALNPAGTMTGLRPRNYSVNPFGSLPYAPAVAIPKIPRSEWSARIKELTEQKALLSDVRMTGMGGKMIPSRDQNGRGYCWAHSSVSAMLIDRAKSNQPYSDLSAYAIACMIKNYRDEGGWNGESMEFLSTRGCPSSKFWAQQSVSRNNDNAETWADAAKHKRDEWVDIAEGDFDTQMTLLMLGFPHALDLNWWSHSICAIDPVEIEPGSFGIRIWNSWGDSWGDRGMGVLTESKARNNGAIALLSSTPSTV